MTFIVAYGWTEYNGVTDERQICWFSFFLIMYSYHIITNNENTFWCDISRKEVSNEYRLTTCIRSLLVNYMNIWTSLPHGKAIIVFLMIWHNLFEHFQTVSFQYKQNCFLCVPINQERFRPLIAYIKSINMKIECPNLLEIQSPFAMNFHTIIHLLKHSPLLYTSYLGQKKL